MNDEQPRTDATNRERSPDHQYSLSIEQTADVYAQAGHPRTVRAIQKYCALSKLDCHKVETETGEKYLVAPYSVERHISYISEVRTDATSRVQTRSDATVRPLENKDEAEVRTAPNTDEQARTDATFRATDDRYVARLESEVDFLRGQIKTKDEQIREQTERSRETNHLIAGLQRLIGPLLSAPKQNEESERNEPTQDLGM